MSESNLLFIILYLTSCPCGYITTSVQVGPPSVGWTQVKVSNPHWGGVGGHRKWAIRRRKWAIRRREAVPKGGLLLHLLVILAKLTKLIKLVKLVKLMILIILSKLVNSQLFFSQLSSQRMPKGFIFEKANSVSELLSY